MLSKMPAKRPGIIAMLILLSVAAAGAVAQKAPAPGTHITVSKTAPSSDDPEGGQFKTIQAAVNAAKPGQVIEILDEAVYEEQVTIDGREGPSPWAGVTSGKNGITLRYVPAGGANAPWNHARPTIKWKDTKNTHPASKAEAQLDNELTGAGNFETNGALRVLRAKGVTIEGIAVDGGGAFAFGADNVWCDPSVVSCGALNHGNAAITLAVAGQVTIRDCELKNAFFGIYVKDRNTGGVFGNPNPANQDYTVPLSGFGNVGGHLFEYNKVGGNVIGFFFESAWDLGSTARYNLIYNNKKGNIPAASWNWVGDGTGQKNGGAFMFKDMYLSPVAIYNNTFYDNSGNFVGHWQSGGQHLIFNNIFSVSTPGENVNHMSLDGKFPYRMNNCVFSADTKDQNGIRVQGQPNFDCENPNAPGGMYIASVQVNGYAACSTKTVTMKTCNNGVLVPGQTQNESVVLPGTALTATTYGGAVPPFTFGSGAGLKWLQTEGFTKTGIMGGKQQAYTQPSLFKSLVSTSADFLVPNWENQLVKDFIKNKGWETAGIRNSDGTMADLGAIPSNGVRQGTVARILPTNVVFISGSKASANFNLKLDKGTMTNTTVKMLRWIAPVPANTTNPDVPGFNGKDWPEGIEVVSQNAIRPITTGLPAVSVGANNGKEFTIPSLSNSTIFGFFEIIIEGKDANGNTVTSDVGFLPYRKLEYTFKIEVLNAAGSVVTTVTAGEPYRLRVTPMNGTTPFISGALSEVSYSLLSAPASFMRTVSGDAELASDRNLPATGKTYDVYFTRAGQETIAASGVYGQGGSRLIFFGTSDIKVTPGAPAKVEFINPVSSTQLGDLSATVINKGQDFRVEVEVQDRFGNAVNAATPVTIVSDKPDIGNAGAPGNIAAKTVSCDATGVAVFTAKAEPTASRGQVFEMTASMAGGASDKGKLRIGRSLDRLQIFYSDNGASNSWREYYDPEVTINGMRGGERHEMSVKVVTDDSVATGKSMYVLVEPDHPDLKFSATATGGASADNVFHIVNGKVTFYVWAEAGGSKIDNAGIIVLALRSADPTDFDGSMPDGARYGIYFNVNFSAIDYAVVYGDGNGRPDSLRIYIKDGADPLTAAALPSKVELMWPPSNVGNSAVIPATGAAISIKAPNCVGVDFTGLPRGVSGYSSVPGSRLVKVYNLNGVGGFDDNFPLYDGIGPLLSDSRDVGRNPVIKERLEDVPAGDPDTIIIKVPELLRNADVSLVGQTLLLIGSLTEAQIADNEANGATGTGTPLNVLSAVLDNTNSDFSTYKITVAHVDGLQGGAWIRFNPAGNVTDRASGATAGANPVEDNAPHARNRWAQLTEKQDPPVILSEWYTSDNANGKPNYAYIVFNKPINVMAWFNGGKVKFESGTKVSVTSTNINDLFSRVGNDTLRIDLAKAYPESQERVRTAGTMSFGLTYGNGAKDMWDDGGINGSANDRAAPVLANSVVLKTGESIGMVRARDTLTVFYSELINEVSMAVTAPVEIILSNGVKCSDITLGNPRGALAGNYYKVTYLVESDLAERCGRYPETGDYVRVNPEAGIMDNMYITDGFGNVQDMVDNLAQPLRVNPVNIGPGDLDLRVTVKNNPLFAGGGNLTEIGMAFNVGEVDINAVITVFDNRGNVVAAGAISGSGAVNWTWDGRDRKGRAVDAGAYLFKAVCEAFVYGDMLKRDTVTRRIGVIRGGNSRAGAESISNAPAGSFIAGANPVSRQSDGSVGFFWDGVEITGGALFVYDASGNIVKKIKVKVRETPPAALKRAIGSWDLTDAKGRAVAEGSYVVKGTITAKDGRKPRVSALVGVGR